MEYKNITILFAILIVVLPISYAQDYERLGRFLLAFALIELIATLLSLSLLPATIAYVIIDKFGDYKISYKKIFFIYLILVAMCLFLLPKFHREFLRFDTIKIWLTILISNSLFIVIYFILKNKNNQKNNITQ